MGLFYFIPLPHWSLWIGWILLGAYLGLFILGFTVAGRWLVHQWRWPLWIAVPVVWVGMELIRCHLFGGLGLGLLAHTQYRNVWVIQWADLGGAYLVSFVLAAASACAANICLTRRVGPRMIAAAAFVGIVALCVGLGSWKSNDKSKLHGSADQRTTVAAVILQGSIDVVFADESKRKELEQQHRDHYRDLALQARRQYPQARMLIWPESTFPETDLIPDTRERELRQDIRERVHLFRDEFVVGWTKVVGLAPSESGAPAEFTDGIAILGGAASVNIIADEFYNSVLLINEYGEIVDRYLKNHCVPFGEYVPLSQWFPFLDALHPYGRSLTFGKSATAIQFEGITLCPSICFESTVPHLVRRHVNELVANGRRPDYLVNITNDGWFFGTNCLDLHLACTVFRAVEMGRPAIVAANTGFSAEIDHRGVILQQGPRRQEALLPVTLYSNCVMSDTLYRQLGDWPWIICAGIAAGACLLAMFSKSPAGPQH